MITEKHELAYARFTDNEKTTIHALWRDPDSVVDADGNFQMAEEYIEAKEGDASYEWLLKFISIDQIHENTVNWIREQNEAFENKVFEIAKARGLIFDGSEDTSTKVGSFIVKEIFTFDPEDSAAKEKLFLYKLAIFEDDVISKSKERKLKSKIRKAKNMIEATKYAIELYELESDSTSE